jgi:uncharacterized protein (TIGR02145 family)
MITLKKIVLLFLLINSYYSWSQTKVVVNYEASKHKGSLLKGIEATTVQSTIPYTHGNGSTYASQSIPSTGVTGLTATLAEGQLAIGGGQLIYTITGTPTTTGTARFALSIGKQTGILSRTVYSCGAYIAPNVFKPFMCHNLGANTSLDPNTPAQGIHGNYYQWGRKNPVANAATPEGEIVGWNTTQAHDGAWNNYKKTITDPCPKGYRVPTKAQWEAVANTTLNLQNRIGSWFSNSSNYGCAVLIGQNATSKTLFLPAAGYRDHKKGVLYNRGFSGNYWSSSKLSSSSQSYYINLNNNIEINNNYRSSGFSIRCIAE